MISYYLFFKDNAYEILFVLCIAIICIFGIYRLITGKKGSWDETYYYKNDIESQLQLQQQPTKKRRVIRESKGETECRKVLEEYFRTPFPKARPNIMNNEVTNFNLEIDCFCPQLKIGCEYNGRQHYDYVPYFHKNKEALQNQKYRDYMKRNLCKEHGIKLIEVPYTVKVCDIRKFIHKELRKMGY